MSVKKTLQAQSVGVRGSDPECRIFPQATIYIHSGEIIGENGLLGAYHAAYLGFAYLFFRGNNGSVAKQKQRFPWQPAWQP